MQFRTPLLLHEVVPSATQVETKRVPLVRCPLIVTICLLVLLLITVTAARLFSIRSQHLTTSISQVPSQTVGTTARTTASASQVPLQTVTATTKTTTLSSTDKKTTTGKPLWSQKDIIESRVRQMFTCFPRMKKKTSFQSLTYARRFILRNR